MAGAPGVTETVKQANEQTSTLHPALPASPSLKLAAGVYFKGSQYRLVQDAI